MMRKNVFSSMHKIAHWNHPVTFLETYFDVDAIVCFLSKIASPPEEKLVREYKCRRHSSPLFKNEEDG
jgi:hypothetical protein